MCSSYRASSALYSGLSIFYGGFAVDLVDDVSLAPRHRTRATYRDTGVAHGPTNLCLTREQRVGNPIGDDLAVAILVGWYLHIEVVAGSPTPQWEESVTREVLLHPRKEVVEVRSKEAIQGHRHSIREDEQANGRRGQIGQQVLSNPLANASKSLKRLCSRRTGSQRPRGINHSYGPQIGLYTHQRQAH